MRAQERQEGVNQGSLVMMRDRHEETFKNYALGVNFIKVDFT
jgi:hypothetical protein